MEISNGYRGSRGRYHEVRFTYCYFAILSLFCVSTCSIENGSPDIKDADQLVLDGTAVAVDTGTDTTPTISPDAMTPRDTDRSIATNILDSTTIDVTSDVTPVDANDSVSDTSSSTDAKTEDARDYITDANIILSDWFCTRDSLKHLTDDFFAGMIIGDSFGPSVRLGDLKYTENGLQLQSYYDALLWHRVSEVRYKQFVLDTDTCNSFTESVVVADGRDYILGMRLKARNMTGVIYEIETIVLPHPYPDTIVAAANEDWESYLPDQIDSLRDELKAVIDGYFSLYTTQADWDAIQFAPSCERFVDGRSIGSCPLVILETSLSIVPEQRYVFDVEAGIAVGFALYSGAINFHMFLVRSGEVHSIRAVIGPLAESSGWPAE